MNREDILRMARKAELICQSTPTAFWVEDHDLTPYLERFAALVAAHEREVCAKVCGDIESAAWESWDITADPDAQGKAGGAIDCAVAIRARGEKP